MTYNELLNQKEWWSKCNEILSRDHYTCKDCGCLGFHNGGNFIKLDRIEEIDTILKGWLFNGMTFSKFWANIPKRIPYPFRRIPFQKEYCEDGLTVYNLNLITSMNKLFPNVMMMPERFIVVSQEQIETLDATVFSFLRIINRVDSFDTFGRAYLFEFPINLTNEIYVNIEYEIIGAFGEQLIEDNIINITSGNRLFSLINHPYSFPLKGLNIHHAHYIKGHKPWEYRDDALVTLCENCHKKRHEKTNTPIYASDMSIIGLTTICPRCGGSGYLPQYSHVEHGICFKCGGEGVIVND